MAKKKVKEVLEEPADESIASNNRIRQIAGMVLVMAVIFLLGLGSGYLKWGQDETAEKNRQKELARLSAQINPTDGYALSVSYGDLGPQLIKAGVIDYDAFIQALSASGDAVSNRQIDILKQGSDDKVVITAENAHFLLNFFWAVGLANRNSILTSGSMVQYSQGEIESFASTGGWTLATKPVKEIYASLDLIPLTPEQQARVEEVASAVYRPCCDNPTSFPDCNHGMAMLGLLALMASQDASTDQMFEAAKYVNAYWFPQQALETALYLKVNEGIEFTEVEPRLVVGRDLSSASGARMVHGSLLAAGLLEQEPRQGGSCAT